MRVILVVTFVCYFTSCGNKRICNDASCGPAANEKTDTASLTCKLTNAEQAAREEKLRATVFSKYEKINETDDALELIYADGKQYAPILLDFIITERECCPFFTFNMKFEPNSNKVSLIIGGSPKMKEMLKKLLVK